MHSFHTIFLRVVVVPFYPVPQPLHQGHKHQQGHLYQQDDPRTLVPSARNHMDPMNQVNSNQTSTNETVEKITHAVNVNPKCKGIVHRGACTCRTPNHHALRYWRDRI